MNSNMNYIKPINVNWINSNEFKFESHYNLCENMHVIHIEGAFIVSLKKA